MPILQLNGDVTVHQISTRSVGDHSYVILAGDTAAVIDPQRDIDRLTGLFGSASLNAVMETHVHNDYVSGGALLASGYGSRYLLPSGSGASVRHDAVVDGDRIDIADGWHLRASTPLVTRRITRHTHSYPVAASFVVFTGGSMLVGAVGRTDLVNPNLTDGLTATSTGRCADSPRYSETPWLWHPLTVQVHSARRVRLAARRRRSQRSAPGTRRW